jgi:hypothetical protein
LRISKLSQFFVVSRCRVTALLRHCTVAPLFCYPTTPPPHHAVLDTAALDSATLDSADSNNAALRIARTAFIVAPPHMPSRLPCRIRTHTVMRSDYHHR